MIQLSGLQLPTLGAMFQSHAAEQRTGGDMDFVEEQGMSVVANGHFNPTIFQPAWLRREGIITAAEEEAAVIGIIHPEITRFEVPGLSFDVQTERCSITAMAEPFIRAADVFYVTLHEKLGHTPITSVGLNYFAHVRLNDWKQRMKFGRLIAPIEPWGEYGALLNSSESSKAGGVSTLSMRAILSDYGKEGGINVSVQPSARVSDQAGVFFNVNHHLAEGAGGDDPLTATLYKRFDDLLAHSRSIIDDMTKRARSL